MAGPTRQQERLIHNEDYSWCKWRGETFCLSKMRAKIVKDLHGRHNREEGPSHFTKLMTEAGSESYQDPTAPTGAHIDALFRGASRRAWRVLVIRAAPGLYMLNPEIAVDPVPAD